MIGAIWADLVVQQHPWLQLGDHTEKRGLAVRGLGSRYERLTADAPDLALGHNAKARLLRLIAPSTIKANDRETFYVLDWPNVDASTALAAIAAEEAISVTYFVALSNILIRISVTREWGNK